MFLNTKSHDGRTKPFFYDRIDALKAYAGYCIYIIIIVYIFVVFLVDPALTVSASVLAAKSNRQYLLTLQVSRYCLFALAVTVHFL